MFSRFFFVYLNSKINVISRNNSKQYRKNVKNITCLCMVMTCILERL